MASVEEEQLGVRPIVSDLPGDVFGGGGLRGPQMMRSMRLPSQSFEESR